MTPLYQVNAFTAVPFAGNPAGVVLLDGPREDEWMRRVSAELNLAETAFLRELPDGSRELRWFTPMVEVPLCGHATLATAHVLFQTGAAAPGEVLAFTTRSSGQVRARQDDGDIVLDFPAYPLREEPLPEAVRAMLPQEVRGAVFLDDLAGDATWLVELEDEDAVRTYEPDLRGLVAAGCGLVVTARAGREARADVVSRCFFPAAGIPEDPVTGAAHCALAPYWAPRLVRTQLTGYQASARGGLVRMRLEGDRVELRGQAVTVFQAGLLV